MNAKIEFLQKEMTKAGTQASFVSRGKTIYLFEVGFSGKITGRCGSESETPPYAVGDTVDITENAKSKNYYHIKKIDTNNNFKPKEKPLSIDNARLAGTSTVAAVEFLSKAGNISFKKTETIKGNGKTTFGTDDIERLALRIARVTKNVQLRLDRNE